MNALHRHEEERVEEVLQNLRAKGIRITDTRRAVLSYLVASHEHPSAEKIYRDLLPQFPSMSLATVYNNMAVSQMWTLKSQIFAKKQLVKVATRSPRPR